LTTYQPTRGDLFLLAAGIGLPVQQVNNYYVIRR